jgi:hypothetical protein
MEQCPPRVLAHDLDHCDFLAAMAPKPVIIMAQEKDYFDARGSAETYERLKKLYTLLGKPENIQLHIGPDPHGYTQSNREAMYRFFGKVTGISAAASRANDHRRKRRGSALHATRSGGRSRFAHADVVHAGKSGRSGGQTQTPHR